MIVNYISQVVNVGLSNVNFPDLVTDSIRLRQALSDSDLDSVDSVDCYGHDLGAHAAHAQHE